MDMFREKSKACFAASPEMSSVTLLVRVMGCRKGRGDRGGGGEGGVLNGGETKTCRDSNSNMWTERAAERDLVKDL